MAYERKLTIAKILVSLGLCMYVLIPFAVEFGVSHIRFDHWHSIRYSNLMALPIMLWAIWGKKLHGTGRSVRLMAFLGVAFTLGFFVVGASNEKLDTELTVDGHEFFVFGMDANIVMGATVLLLLLAGIILSIRRGPGTK